MEKPALMLNMLKIRSFIFVHSLVNKSLKNWAKERVFTDVVQHVQWCQNHGVDLTIYDTIY